MVSSTGPRTITITLLTITGTIDTEAANKTTSWTPAAGVFDGAGVGMSTTRGRPPGILSADAFQLAIGANVG